MKWFYREWWAYLLAPRSDRSISWLAVILCRARGHDKVVWFNIGGTEPDMHCMTCRDDLG